MAAAGVAGPRAEVAGSAAASSSRRCRCAIGSAAALPPLAAARRRRGHERAPDPDGPPMGHRVNNAYTNIGRKATRITTHFIPSPTDGGGRRGATVATAIRWVPRIAPDRATWQIKPGGPFACAAPFLFSWQAPFLVPQVRMRPSAWLEIKRDLIGQALESSPRPQPMHVRHRLMHTAIIIFFGMPMRSINGYIVILCRIAPMAVTFFVTVEPSIDVLVIPPVLPAEFMAPTVSMKKGGIQIFAALALLSLDARVGMGST